jgi:hypothetical protein
MKFQAAIRDLVYQGSLAILGLAVFGDPDQLLISNLSTYLSQHLDARLLGPVSEDSGSADRCNSILEI